MTSVQNRRRPLSGNKIIICSLCLVMMFISSCGLFSHTTKEPTVQKKDYPDKTIEKKDPVIKEPEKKTIDSIGTAVKGKSWDKKEVYDVAFVLPFSTDEAELSKLLGEDNITGYQPLASLEFYEGALMAIDTLKKLGVNLNISVYDHKKDSAATAILMQREEFKKMDLIIGPVFNEGLKAATEISKKNETFLVSPLSPTTNFTTDNRYFFMANPPVSEQINKTISFLLKDHPTANFIVVYRNEKPHELKIASEFKEAFALVNKNNLATLKEAFSFSGISSNLNNSDNFVFLASNDELYVNGLIRDLSKSSRNNSVTLIGLQNLLSLESISLDYFETLHFHYPTSYWVDQNSVRVKNFNTAFTNKYEIRPSEFAYRGYDIMMYFGLQLKNYGPDIASQIDKPNLAIRYMLYPLGFTPCYSTENKIKFIENNNVTILKYQNFRFEKAN
ncbi:MAG: ABC transporter substrate-binding protein [Chitinophagales bacterium]